MFSQKFNIFFWNLRQQSSLFLKLFPLFFKVSGVMVAQVSIILYLSFRGLENINFQFDMARKEKSTGVKSGERADHSNRLRLPIHIPRYVFCSTIHLQVPKNIAIAFFSLKLLVTISWF